MVFNGPLFRWQFRRLRWVTLIALVIALAYVLFEPNVLRFRMIDGVIFFVFFHCTGIAGQFGRPQSRSFGFLYSQGYSRDAIWGHMMLASATSVLIVWFPPTLTIWLGLRCGLQDLMLNYRFPYSAPLEYFYPLWILLLYILFLPAFHYAWIRNLQPMRSPMSGSFLLAAVFLAVFSIGNSIYMERIPVVSQWLIVAGLLVATISLMVGSRRLHREMEVV